MGISAKILRIAIDASIFAGKVIMEVYEKPHYTSELKQDQSPLTEADLAASKVINFSLANTGYPIISEENKNSNYDIRKDWKYCWIVDPLDGTKEFIKRNGEFTVNIALCKNGIPILGVIYVPFTRELFYADVHREEAFKTIVDNDYKLAAKVFDVTDRIYPAKPNKKSIRVVGSRSHMNQMTLDYISALEKEYENVDIVSKGSSLKFCLVAEGIADVYPRFAPTMEWDTAAGQAICSAVGLKVNERDTKKPLLYNKDDLLNPFFIVHH
ncbi:3'(2'),5'-bisphosphate nucleotidase [Pricia antarctica]|uniref:3'(2'),5'-bisphosphate nucleotidase CysQ n=1 Tax=Pricia antarctica TaxID=641691 RepID=A0A1G7FLR3_9FLAO|nr:3'(2'),5'-bisphosphate nucleotidase CysQ [Pricia antarctica]SDE76605.1 3'(2'),5'-bisphosphate nucleotidase [Pricia antarctica]